jgi:hypothetical protein
MLRFSERDAHDFAAKRERFVTGAAPRTPRDVPVLTHKVPPPLERDVQGAILGLLQAHHKVACAWRQNTGGAWLGPVGAERYVRFAFKGCSDILGMLKGGRFLAIEVKRPGVDPTGDQLEFLGRVHRGGGLAFVARDVDDVVAKLAAA